MFSTVILAVGLELQETSAVRQKWQRAGYFVTWTNSIREAIEWLRVGDFDLVLLGDALSEESRERLAFLIRASGTNTPVYSITGSPNPDAFVDVALDGKPDEAFRKIREILEREPRLSGRVGSSRNHL